eukprot:CAMPEP_0115859022 /NCGR_PEP_ID=MMETSP0287-20121206/16399_1 /TAXON_ID=412157 /ORGANISM="Chrysochromulina rotalis, Strain UIO044" /LENGTH=165 /DNA_ID=CAMNT_0003313305 /DNA_START=483 /DNA_END=980 /DNA_ORIENTATION=+
MVVVVPPLPQCTKSDYQAGFGTDVVHSLVKFHVVGSRLTVRQRVDKERDVLHDKPAQRPCDQHSAPRVPPAQAGHEGRQPHRAQRVAPEAMVIVESHVGAVARDEVLHILIGTVAVVAREDPCNVRKPEALLAVVGVELCVRMTVMRLMREAPVPDAPLVSHREE